MGSQKNSKPPTKKLPPRHLKPSGEREPSWPVGRALKKSAAHDLIWAAIACKTRRPNFHPWAFGGFGAIFLGRFGLDQARFSGAFGAGQHAFMAI